MTDQYQTSLLEKNGSITTSSRLPTCACIPHASAKTRSLGIMCFNPWSFGLATSSRSRKFAPLTRFVKNSSRALRGEFGICHDASSRDTLPEGERPRSWDGVTNRGTADKDMALLEEWRAPWINFDLLMRDKETMFKLKVVFRSEFVSDQNGTSLSLPHLPP